MVLPHLVDRRCRQQMLVIRASSEPRRGQRRPERVVAGLVHRLERREAAPLVRLPIRRWKSRDSSPNPAVTELALPAPSVVAVSGRLPRPDERAGDREVHGDQGPGTVDPAGVRRRRSGYLGRSAPCPNPGLSHRRQRRRSGPRSGSMARRRHRRGEAGDRGAEVSSRHRRSAPAGRRPDVGWGSRMSTLVGTKRQRPSWSWPSGRWRRVKPEASTRKGPEVGTAISRPETPAASGPRRRRLSSPTTCARPWRKSGATSAPRVDGMDLASPAMPLRGANPLTSEQGGARLQRNRLATPHYPPFRSDCM